MPTDAETMIAAGRAHLEGYLHPERAFDVPLAPGFRRTELPPVLPRELGGALAITSAEEQRAYYSGVATRFITGYHDMRWVIDIAACEATLFALIDYDAPGISFTIHMGERFRISDGLLEEIEVISWRETGSGKGSCWPDGADPDEGRAGPCGRSAAPPPYGSVPGCEPGTREQIVAAGDSYLGALVSRDGSGVPLAETARRTEKPWRAPGGPVTGTSGSEIAASLQSHPRYDGIVGIRDVRWFVDAERCQATVFYLVDGDPAVPDRRGTRHHVTRFLVSGGVIHEIEDVWRGPVDPSRTEGSCWPQRWSDAEDESYRLVACPA